MIRFDIQAGVITALALGASLSTAFWLNRATDDGRAEAATPVAVVETVSEAPRRVSGAQVVKAADGHYWTEATVNGRAVRMLVDTGATAVALTRDDALRLGFMLEADDFDRTVSTASGQARAAKVTLDAVSVAGARVAEVEALVVERGLEHSLLGMTYLGRLSRIEATPNGLTLRP